MATQSKTVFATVVAALFAVAAFSVYATEPVKAGGPSDKPGRSLDNDVVKAQGAGSKPDRTMLSDDSSAGTPVKAPNKKKAGRTIEESTVKSQGTSDKAGRAVDKAGN